METSLEMWLWLLLVMQPHNPGTYKILDACGYDIKRACIQVRNGAFPFLTAKENKRAQEVGMNEIQDLQRLCRENGINIIPIDSPDYPEKLRLIANPPIVLFAQGDLCCLKNRLIVSAVGTRRPSEYSISISRQIAGQLASAGAAVVSGLAVGLDSAAHRGALEANGVTVGVLACGSLVNYPAENSELKKEIVRKGGAVISELMPNDPCPNGYFPMRNRIIAGIADSVLVLEAGLKSGTLLTANHAFEMRRRVFVISPHSIFEERYAGQSELYRKGASLVFGAEDILNAFMLTRSDNGNPAKPADGSEHKLFLPKGTVTPPPLVPAGAPAAVGNAPTKSAPAADAESVQPDQPVKSDKSDKSAQSEKSGWTSKFPPPAGLDKLDPKEAELILKLLYSNERYIPFPEKPGQSGKQKKKFKPTAQIMPGLDYVILKALTEKPMTIEEIMNRFPDPGYDEITDALTYLELEGFITKNQDGTYSRV